MNNSEIKSDLFIEEEVVMKELVNMKKQMKIYFKH